MVQRRRITLWLDSDLFEKFNESIKETGLSASRVIETVMRVNVSKHGAAIQDIFEAVFNIGRKHERKSKK